MIASVLALFPLALGALASPLPSPSLTSRQTAPGPQCSGLGAGAFDIAYNFTLAAYNVTLPNANSTGAPLVIGQAGAVDGESFKVLSTWATYPFNDYPNYSLLNGVLHPNGQSGVVPSDYAPTDGAELGFIVEVNAPTGAPIYCAVADTDPNGGGTGFPELALNGDTDSFSLCSEGDFPSSQTNVVYKASAAQANGYVFDSCYPVRLQLIGLD